MINDHLPTSIHFNQIYPTLIKNFYLSNFNPFQPTSTYINLFQLLRGREIFLKIYVVEKYLHNFFIYKYDGYIFTKFYHIY